MKIALSILVVSFILPLGGSSANPFPFHSPFDSYGAICWEDEKARLDSFAIALQNSPDTIGNIIVYEGKHACRGEAIARAIRAKKYLVEYRKVESNRIAWRFGGHHAAGANTTLVLNPRDAPIWPLTPSLSEKEVTFVGSCSRTVRPVKCPKR